MCRPDLTLAEATYGKELKELVDAGFSNKRQNLKLLFKTQGDVETVKNFLLAKNALKLKLRLVKDTKKEFDKKAEKKEKKLEKLAMKEEKKALKEEKKALKEEKKVLKEEKKSLKEEKKLKKNKEADSVAKRSDTNNNSVEETAAYKLSEKGWPSGPVHLYLDGNNMLFVVAAVRSLVLKRKTAAAESVLEAFARKFASAMGVKHCTLIFDDTKKSVVETGFTVCSARPSYPTSDDALVEYAQTNTGTASVFVSSDRGLMARLRECGDHVILVKPKDWFHYAASVLSDTKGVVDLDKWMLEWIKADLGSDANIAQELQTKLNL